MHVLLDVHVVSNDQQSAVACSIASSHENLLEVTSMSSCVDLNTPSVVPSTVSQRKDLCLEFGMLIGVCSLLTSMQNLGS